MERVQKLIAQAGICSRRKAEALLEQGLVTVNGRRVELGAQASTTDTIKVAGQTIRPERNVYYLLHKPKGYLTTVTDPHGRNNVVQLIPDPKRIFPVGRLDKDTTGLLLLTNDGEFANRITHPRYEVEKTYEAVLDRRISQEDIDTINKGVMIEKRLVVPVVKRLSGKRVRITIHTGLNKEVKRIFKRFGYWVRGLKRTRIGPVKLNVKEGKYRRLTRLEIQQFLSVASASRCRPPCRAPSRPCSRPSRR